MTRNITLAAIAAFASCACASAATQRTVAIRDWTGRGFPPDMVTYVIDTPADGGRSIRVLDTKGASLPVQIAPRDDGKATLSFVAEVTANETSTYTIQATGRAPVARPAATIAQEADTLVLSNQLVAMRVPATVQKTYRRPVSASTLRPPVLSFRGPDGRWRGAASVLSTRTVKTMSIERTAAGPVYVETAYRLEYADGGYYECRIRVTDRAPFARITEEYDLAVNANANYWQLDLSKGWDPDAAGLMRVAGQGFSPVRYPSLAKEEKTVASGPSVGADFPGGGGAPTRSIHHDSCWGSRYVSYYGIHNAAARKAAPKGYPLAIVAPLHKGAWRRANSIQVYVKSGKVTVRFPMDVAPISWKNEPASDVSPFSCHEHDPALPVSTGRRIWALVLAHPSMLVDGYGRKNTLGPGYAVRNLYGTVGLDRYKDFVLEWPDTGVTYPRVFITPEGVKKYRDAVGKNPTFPLARKLKGYYWFTGDAATAQKEVREVHKRLHGNINYIMRALSIHHHQTLAQYGEPIGHTESVLSWPDLPDADRAKIRARLALLSYLLCEPDVTSAGNSSHHGNPNMGISRLMDRSNLPALIPDHPMHKTWRDYMAGFMAYKTGTFMAPEGGWFEYGASYHMHGYSKILRGMAGVLASGAPQSDRMFAYHRADFDYYLNLLSPLDPRYGSRTIPGAANAAVGSAPHMLQSMGIVEARDPEFAANLYWGWNDSGKFVATGADGITLYALARPWIEPRKPRLTSRSYPGFGVIFRAHQGENETCMYLRSGYLWSHWNQDQGNLMLYAKGGVMLPCQPYQYGGPKDKSFPDKNLMRFGAPTNDMPHDWADSNILDSHFAGSVDYAWASTGYPEWFINPGYKEGFGEPRELAGDPKQNEGAFTWNRQVMFVKGATATGPNYFVVRDTVPGEGRLASWFNLNFLGTREHVAIARSKVTVDTEWSTDLDVLFVNRAAPKLEIHENPTGLSPAHTFNIVGRKTGEPISRDWLSKKGGPATVKLDRWQRAQFGGGIERQVQLRMQSAPGRDVAWVLYPRGANEAAPSATQLAPGVVKVDTSEGTDYVFLSPTPIEYQGEGVEFNGLAGAVRVSDGGAATLVLSAGPGTVGWRGQVVAGDAPFERFVPSRGRHTETIPSTAWTTTPLATPPGPRRVAPGLLRARADGKTTYVVEASSAVDAADGNVSVHARRAAIEIHGEAIRFLVPERAYAQLSVGNVGVRGVGPFDLTFTDDGITGRVDGDVRTIVTTWPEKITRPGYTMDWVRYYAGFADEHSIVKGAETPQFAIAMGVSAGPHFVEINEWEWPAMPVPPARSRLDFD